MSIATYVDLQAAVVQWTNRSDLGALVADFVTLAEARMSADLSAKALEREQSVTITDAVAALPADVLDITGLRLDGATRPEVEVTSRERLAEAAADERRALAAIVGRTLELSVSSGTLAIRAKCRVPALADNATNWVLTTFPNVYLFGALAEAYDYLRDDEQSQKYLRRYAEAVAQANIALYRGTQSHSKVRWAP